MENHESLSRSILRYILVCPPTQKGIIVTNLVGKFQDKLSANSPFTREQIESCIAFLVTNKLLSLHKGLLGLSSPQRISVDHWTQIDDILRQADGDTDGRAKGNLQSASSTA